MPLFLVLRQGEAFKPTQTTTVLDRYTDWFTGLPGDRLARERPQEGLQDAGGL